MLIMSAILLIPSTEKTDGVYASIPGVQELLLSSDEYTAMYDYVAQVCFLALMSNFTFDTFKCANSCSVY